MRHTHTKKTLSDSSDTFLFCLHLQTGWQSLFINQQSEVQQSCSVKSKVLSCCRVCAVTAQVQKKQVRPLKVKYNQTCFLLLSSDQRTSTHISGGIKPTSSDLWAAGCKKLCMIQWKYWFSCKSHSPLNVINVLPKTVFFFFFFSAFNVSLLNQRWMK